MPDIILLNNTPGLSLSAPYANLSPYITSLYESNGLGFKGFSINDLGPTSEYKFTSDLYKNDKDNFKFFDIILKDVPGAVPGYINTSTILNASQSGFMLGAVDSFGACCHGFLAICFSEST